MFSRRTITAAFAFMTFIVLAGCAKNEESISQPLVVTAYTVEAREVPIYMEWVGQTNGSFNVDIRARVEGNLDAITYEEGRNVSAGQTMFKIDPSTYRSLVSQARARLAEAQATNARARQDLARYKPLVQENAISRQEYDAAVAIEQATASTVNAMQAALDNAELDLSFCNVKSPISGVASIAAVGTGNLVGRGENTLLATVSKLDPIRVIFNLSEKEFLAYKRSAQNNTASTMPVQLRLADGSIWPHQGKIVVADNAVDLATGTLHIEAEFANPGDILRPGQFGRIRVTQELRQGAIVIPARAITELQGQARVAVVKNNKVGFRNVELGQRIGSVIVVESGLVAGEQIIIDGLQMIRDGMPVTTKPSAISIDSLISSK
jgi:membrane fusion protein (multidrug efflux system)